MSTTPWHLEEQLAQEYAEGGVPAVLASSIEQHLVTCAHCRELLRPAADPDRLGRVWEEVLDQVQAPRITLTERALRVLKVEEGTARLVATTPSLRGAWLTGVVVVLALAVLAAQGDRNGLVAFMALAPVLPVAAVALAFGPGTDPSHEIAAAAPYSSLHLLAVRTAVVVTSTLVPTSFLALLLPGGAWLSVAWLLPALALTVGTLALAPWVAPHLAGTALAATWATAVILGFAYARDPLLMTGPLVQLASLAVLLVGGGALFLERDDLPELLRRLT